MPRPLESLILTLLAPRVFHPNVQAVVNPNEPPLPGEISMDQAIKFTESLIRGGKYRWDIIKDVVKDKVREVMFSTRSHPLMRATCHRDPQDALLPSLRLS